ncbi:hypothetical protein F4778DRAFT_728622 [Xylariomycetidae sp. FL2044]|nr:hypothetical protein F4778DRAFT_728622 [Xylariomycetidae sp. FL2044]
MEEIPSSAVHATAAENTQSEKPDSSNTEAQERTDEPRGVKRPAEEEIETIDDGTPRDQPALSKNQQRKLRRQQQWEEKKKNRSSIRKEKRHQKAARRREARETEITAAAAEGREPVFAEIPRKRAKHAPLVPVSVILDCQFEKYMMDKERVSLASQVTRCYSDNRNSDFPVHMLVSSWGGEMKERFETVLDNHHKRWQHVHLVEGDFMEAAQKAKDLMNGPHGGTMNEALETSKHTECISPADDIYRENNEGNRSFRKPALVPEPEAGDVDKSIVYLTADSPYTIERLEPNISYVVGGIIDKNREKGLCYKIARERKVRTAKLPIGDYMVLQSRHVLTTNQVMEIMLKWLELGDWGAAFMKVIPLRKGGTLKDGETAADAEGEKEEDDEAGDYEGLIADDAAASGVQEPEGDEIAAKADALMPKIPGGEETSGENGDAPIVQGENSERGLEKNALDQSRWSAPPPEPEENSQNIVEKQKQSSGEDVIISDAPEPGVRDPENDEVAAKADAMIPKIPGGVETHESQSALIVEGENSEDGLEKNALDEPRWSAPPS